MRIGDAEEIIDINGSNLKIAIILPYFNEAIGIELLNNTIAELLFNKVKTANISIIRVAGALEIPYALKKIIEKNEYDAAITLGVIIRGETSHFDLVCDKTFDGIMKVQLEKDFPVSIGIITAENEDQARDRAGKDGKNIGKHAAKAALLQTIL